jgi:hypothetical protein
MIPGERVGQTDTRAGAQRRVDGRLLGADGCPTEGAWVPDGGRVSGVARWGSI